MSLMFKTDSRGIPYVSESPWMIQLYQNLFNDKKNGFLVELGVGHVLRWREMDCEPKILSEEEFKNKAVRGCNNTIDLLENGWSGIYIDPIDEFITNELNPLLKQLLPKEQFDKIKTYVCGASDDNYIAKIVYEETINIVSKDVFHELNDFTPYKYQQRLVKCRKTSDILTELDCPKEIDLLSIDVEGHELHALKGIDFDKHLPKVIVVETNKITKEQIKNVLPNNYNLLCYDYLNSVFILN